jgi:hypothetical protein
VASLQQGAGDCPFSTGDLRCEATSDTPDMATGPGARAGLVATEPGQEAAGDSLGTSIEGLASGDDGLDSSGDAGLVASGLVTGAVVGTPAGDELAPGLLHAAIAPTRAKASRVLLNMNQLLGCARAGGSSGSTGGAGP